MAALGLSFRHLEDKKHTQHCLVKKRCTKGNDDVKAK